MSESAPPLMLTPIGIIRSPYKNFAHMPIQPAGACGVVGEILLERDLCAGLKDLEGFSHIFVLYHFHRAGDARLSITLFLDNQPHGVFATCAPTRPNPIGLSVLKLLGIQENLLIVENIDILDGTPLLDIKPYVPGFDQPRDVHTGWLQGVDEAVTNTRSDARFS